jgi:type II secretion system protein D
MLLTGGFMRKIAPPLTALLLVLALAAVISAGEPAPPPVQAPPAAPPAAGPIKQNGDDTVSINFSGTSIKEVIRMVEQYTGKRFMFDEGALAGRKVNVMSSTPIPVKELFNVFQSILEVNGLTIVKSGSPDAEIYKIVEASKAAGKPTPTYSSKELEGVPETDTVITLVYQMKYLAAERVAKAFKGLTTVQDGIVAIEGTNLLRITDYAANAKRLGKMFDSLDVMGPKIVRETIKLKNVEPEELVNEIQPILNIENRVYMAQMQRQMEQRIQEIIGRRGGPQGQQQQTSLLAGQETIMAVAAVPRLGSVIVSASEDKIEDLKKLIESLDISDPDEKVVKYYKLTYQTPSSLADILNSVFGTAENVRQRRMRRGPVPEPMTSAKNITVVADEEGGQVIVIASKKLHEEVAAVIEQLDSTPEDERELRYYPLQYADAETTAKTIAQLFGLETATDPRLQQLMQARRNRRNQPGAPESEPKTRGVFTASSMVMGDKNLSALIVIAHKSVHEKIADVLLHLDIEGVGENELKYYSVKQMDLKEAANIISQVFGIPLGSVDSAYRPMGRAPSSSAITKERVVIPNENLNTLIVVAPREIQKEIEETIAKMDTTGPRDNILKIYDATASGVTITASTLSQLFNIKLAETTTRAARNQKTATGVKLGTEAFILPDEELGTIIVNAPENIHEEIRKVMEKLTTLGQEEKMTIHFYKLKNTDAEEVASKIGGLFNITVSTTTTTGTGAKKTVKSTNRTASGKTSSSRKARTTEGREDEEDQTAPGAAASAEGAASEVPETAPVKGSGKKEFFFQGESVVIPDKNLNSIILIAPEYIHAEAAKIIERLDVRRPQVLFEVAILDVSLDHQFDFGAEIITMKQSNKTNAVGHAFSNFGLSTRSGGATGGFPNNTSVRTDLEGILLGVTKGEVGNVPLLLRMLQDNTDVKIHSTPLLLVNDNEEAKFSSLTEYPTTATSQGTATTKISFAGFVEAGTTLTITPHVSEGNYIRVDIDLKIDNFYGESSEPGIPPPKASNQLKTSITVPDSRTVVIGGLKTTKLSTAVKKVPILGDIPLLGYFFRSETEVSTSSRLFLFIRPQIICDVEFRDLDRATRAKAEEVRRITGDEIVPPESEDEKSNPDEAPVPDAENREKAEE